MFQCLPQAHGPFDIIGDVHGCCDELETLLDRLGYTVIERRPGHALASGPVYRHPAGRKAIFLGDMVDRGPRILDTLRLIHNMLDAGAALAVIGNHDDKLLRKLKGRQVQITHGLETTLAELDTLPTNLRPCLEAALERFLERLPNHLILDEGGLVVAHAGLKEHLVGTATDKTRAFALYGETTGQKDEYGLPIRGNWPERYHGKALVVYGHTPVPEVCWQGNTVDVDTGCVFGGHLTALRYPERETCSVPAGRVYYHSAKPFPQARPAHAGT